MISKPIIVTIFILAGIGLFWLGRITAPSYQSDYEFEDKNQDEIKEPLDAYFYECREDSDCVSVRGECCGCSSGGTATAINKKYKEEWENKLINNCQNNLCLAGISDDWTCFAEPECIKGKCELVESD